nr:hypothetical protein [Sphingomonas sp. CCH16-B10]
MSGCAAVPPPATAPRAVGEGVGRKLQFGSGLCVLDTYLYPPNADGSGVPVVKHIDARQRSGGPIDRASCVAALTRR